ELPGLVARRRLHHRGVATHGGMKVGVRFDKDAHIRAALQEEGQLFRDLIADRVAALSVEAEQSDPHEGSSVNACGGKGSPHASRSAARGAMPDSGPILCRRLAPRQDVAKGIGVEASAGSSRLKALLRT